ncbi:MAG TPA: Ig-like domain-containing protein [Gemmatimonadales bacterium]|nr:Ig-like domain-containing protein [Gemmatimonadales bacterium]
MRRGIATLSLCLCPLLAGCSQDPTSTADPGGPSGEVTITLSTPPASLAIGSQTVLTATVRGPDGSDLDDVQTVVWSTSDSTIATVGGQSPRRGTVTARAVGKVSITAQAAGASASVPLAVDSGGTGGGGNGGNQDSLVASVTIVPLAAPLAFGTQARLVAEARNSAGVLLPNIIPTWSSSRAAVVAINDDGIATAVGIGQATITARVNTVSDSVLVSTTAIGLALFPYGVNLTVGDSLHIIARLKGDYPMGPPGPIQSAVTWASSNPAVISISPSGWATALPGGEGQFTIITASVGGVTGELYLSGSSIPSGLPAGVRYVYGGDDIGPLAVQPSKGSSVTLNWGEGQEQAIGSGTLQVSIDGLGGASAGWPTPEFAGVIPPSRSLTLYATSYASITQGTASAIIPVWDEAPAVPADTALVRLVMTSWYAKSYIGNNIYVLPAGAPIDDFPLFCYFDLGAISPYLHLGSGEWDIVIVDPESFVLVPGHPGHEYFRFRVTPEVGKATTYAIIGNDSSTMRLITTVEP